MNLKNINDGKIWFEEVSLYPRELTEAYVYKCPCGSNHVWVSNQESKTNPGYLCHLLVCLDCGKFCALGSMDKTIEHH